MEFEIPLVSSWVKIPHLEGGRCFMRGYESLIMLFEKDENQLTPIAFVEHQLTLKFELLTTTSVTFQFSQGFGMRSVRGFRLRDDFNTQLDLLV